MSYSPVPHTPAEPMRGSLFPTAPSGHSLLRVRPHEGAQGSVEVLRVWRLLVIARTPALTSWLRQAARPDACEPRRARATSEVHSRLSASTWDLVAIDADHPPITAPERLAEMLATASCAAPVAILGVNTRYGRALAEELRYAQVPFVSLRKGDRASLQQALSLGSQVAPQLSS